MSLGVPGIDPPSSGHLGITESRNIFWYLMLFYIGIGNRQDIMYIVTTKHCKIFLVHVWKTCGHTRKRTELCLLELSAIVNIHILIFSIHTNNF
jgi:hypothetical protein